MSFGRQFVRLVSRLLIAALLLQVALPSWAAFGTPAKASWMEICAAGGIQWVKVAKDSAAAAETHVSGEHCLLCAATGAVSGFDAAQHLHPWLRDEAATRTPWPAHRRYAGHAILSRAPPV